MARRRAGAVVLALVALVGVSALGAGTATADPLPGALTADGLKTTGFQLLGGHADGGTGKLVATNLPTASIAGIAPQGTPCEPESGHTYSNMVSRVNVSNASVGVVLQSGQVVDQGTLVFDTLSADMQERSTIANVLALGGLITGTAIEARAHSSRAGGVIDNHLGDGSTGVTLTDVHIGTTAVAASPLPNTNVDLPGVGHVVLNEQTVTSKGVDVKAIHVFVDSLAGYHGDFVIAHASTFDRGTTAGFLDASAFALRAHIAKVLDTGTLGLVSIGCLGSGEKTVTMAETTVPLVDGTVLAHTQTAAAAASGVVGSRSDASERVQGVSLAAGRVTADAVSVTASTVVGVAGVTSRGSTTILNLVIDGQPVAVPASPTTIPIANLGTLYIGEQRCTSDVSGGGCTAAKDGGITVDGLRLVLARTNSLGLPLGSEIVVASAHTRQRVP